MDIRIIGYFYTMKAKAKQYLENIYRAIAESTSAKVPSYGYFLEMLKAAVKSDGGKVVGEGYFTVELPTMILDSDEIYEWFSKK